MSNNRHLKAAGQSIASNIFVQILSRGVTFILGSITLKYLESGTLLGIINVRLALLYTTLQFLAREPFRRGCLGPAARAQPTGRQRIINTIWLGLPLSLILAILLTYTWRWNSPTSGDLSGTTIEDYNRAVYMICVSAIVEIFAEPCYIYAQAKAITEHNPAVEIVYVISKCVFTTLIVILESNKYKTGQSSNILTKVASCQLVAASLSTLYSYARLCSKQGLSPKAFFPRYIQDAKTKGGRTIFYNQLDESSLKLSMSFVSNTLLKQILTEGERYVMTFFNAISLEEQGIYDVINNLGSLTARLIFKPIEESGYTLFSQTVKRNENLDARKFFLVKRNLTFLIKFVVLFGLVVLALGYNYVPLIVIYGGEKLNNHIAFSLMRWQLLYTPILALNGMTECFTFAIMDASEVRGYNLPLISYSAIFLISVLFTQGTLSSACFIFSNCLMMACRIFISSSKIRSYFERHGFKLDVQDVMPSLTTLISLAMVYGFLYFNSSSLNPSSLTSLIYCFPFGLASLIYISIIIMFQEEDLVDFIYELFNKKRSDTH